MTTVVFVEEQVLDGPARFAATFSARSKTGPGQDGERLDGLVLEDALAWGRQRSGIVLVRYGGRTNWWSAGATPHWSYSAWPPPEAPALDVRPVPPNHWRETGFVFEGGLQWAVTLWLHPRALSQDPSWSQENAWRVAVATAASACRSRWDSECIDHFLADARRAGPEADAMFSMWPPAYRVYFVIDAASAPEAEAIAAAACDLPEAFEWRWSARPADLEDRP